MGGHCTYEIIEHGEKAPCDRDVFDDDEKCIFHSHAEGKSALFRASLESKHDGDFTGFVFPEKVDESMVPNEIVFKTDGILSVRNQEIREDDPGYDRYKYLKGLVSDEHILRGIEEGNKNVMTFTEKLIFNKAIFLRGCNFSYSNFAKQVDMSECKFYEKCFFNGSHFIGKMILDGVDIYGSVDFTQAFFHDAGFSYTGKRGCIAEGQGNVLFQDAGAARPEKMIFQYAELRHWSFLRTDVSKFIFGICRWDNSSSIKPRGRAKANILQDELDEKWSYTLLRSYHQGRGEEGHNEKYVQTLMEVLALYRGLRAAYENTLRHNEARDFHIGEMEIRRLLILCDKDRQLFRILSEYIVTCLYKWISLYGESYTRPLLWFIGITAVFSILYMFSGISFEPDPVPIKYSLSLSIPDLSEAIRDFFIAFFHSLSVAILLIKEKRFTYLNNCGWTLSVIESVFGAVIIPLFLLAVGRNFKRWRVDS